ncbi:MAG TPA: TonB-dependent receptor [Steroidobacteraceae bacterium]
MPHFDRRCHLKLPLNLALGLGLILAAHTVVAQPQAQAQPSADILEEIVVTAQRVEQRLQDTPIAITAFLAGDIEKLNIRNVGDAAAFTPNFISNPGPTGGNDAFYFIRGVGQTDLNPATDPGVATYVDGVYLGRVMGASIDANSVQRIEILRGPQGTLFGRNTIGGAVNITTLDPAKIFGGEVDLIAGSRNLRQVRASIDLPFTDSQGLRLYGDWRDQDGWGRRASDGTLFDTNHLASGGGKYKWTPTDSLSLTLEGDASKLTGTSQHTILVGFNQVAPGGGPLFSPLGVPIPAGMGNYANPPNPYVNNSSIDPRKDETNSGGALTLDWNLGPFKLQSISAYRQLKQNVPTDYDSTPYDFYEGGFLDRQHQWSEELHLSGDTGPAKWLLGAFYFKEHNDNINLVSLGGNNGCLPFPVTPPPGNPFYYVYPVCNFAGGQTYATPLVNRKIINNQAFTLDTKAEALFGQTTIKLVDHWSATLGLRWTEETKQQDYNFFIDNTAGVANLAGIPPALIYTLSPNNPFNTAPTNYNKTWVSVTPKAGIEYKPDENFLYYLSYAKGFKSGGFNGRPNPGANGNFGGITPYDPERIDTYEVGAKTQFADNRVRVNAALFQSNYKGIQLLAIDLSTPGVSGFFNTLNAAESRIRGVEIELQAVPFAAFQIDAGLGYTKDQYLSLTPGVQASGIEYGMDLPLTPRVNGSVGAQYGWNIAEGKLTVRADYSFRTQFWYEADNTPINRQGGYGIVNGRATYDLPGGHWTVAAYGLNLTNKFYHTNVQDVTAALGVAFAGVSPPREWGGELHYRFGH